MTEQEDRRIVRAAIHPSIGVARVGNSPDGFFIGPEVADPPPLDAYKDDAGAIKRQAARFRVYGYDAAGKVVRELTDVTWTVHVANTKAAWYEFQIALDIPEATLPGLAPSALRNQAVLGGDRAQLAIDPGPRTIQGAGQHGVRFDTGSFFGMPVYLGELRTDEAGRLLVLGAHGVSASHSGAPLQNFANNDDWHDDVSDGPVTATVKVGGRTLHADPAWVLVAPPNYAPPVVTVRTVYDLLYDAFVQSGALVLPKRPSFTRDILPILRRMTGLQWVNHGFAARFGWGGREHFLDPGYLERLASPAPASQELRQQIWGAFRNWERDGIPPVPWPWMYGDAMNIPAVSPRQGLALSETQMLQLERWAAGEFEADLDAADAPPRTLDDVKLAEQPRTLDRAALDHCLADAFHPGCEVTWPIRHTSMFMAPFRIRHRTSDDSVATLRQVLTPDAALSLDGPLYGQEPGSLTRWMAVPWQADTSSCRSGYDPGFGSFYDPYLPTFWSAHVPNHVLTQEDYEIVIDEGRPAEERAAAFARRANWLRFLTPRAPQYLTEMVQQFGLFGIVETRPGPADGAFPAELLVESEVGFKQKVNPLRGFRQLHVPAARDPEVAEAAIAAAIDASPHDPEEITAGYLTQVARFNH